MPEGKTNEVKKPPASQAEADLQARALIQEHFAAVYRLGTAVLNDASAAREAAIEAFIAARAELPHHTKSSGFPVWLYALALKSIHHREHKTHQSAGGRPHTGGKLPEPAATIQPGALWQIVDRFGQKERLLAILIYLLSWTPAQAAGLLHVSPGAVQAQLDIFRREFQEKLAGPGTTKKKLGKKQANLLDEQVRDSLQTHWPEAQFSPPELENIIQEILKPESAQLRAARRLALPSALALTGAVVVGVICLIAVAGVWIFRQEIFKEKPVLSLSGPVTTELGLPTPFASVPKAQALSRYSNSNAIQQRLQESSTLWRTLWIDAQIIDYGPASYNGPPKETRDQAWVAQPGQSIELFGLLNDKPDSLYQVTGEQEIYVAPLAGETATSSWDGTDKNLLHNSTLQKMVFPGDYPWASGEGSFKSIRSDKIAGHNAIVADWTNADGLRAARLWIDDRTGILLRLQEYGGESGQTLMSEALTTEILLDKSYPPAALVELVKLENGRVPPWSRTQLPEQTILQPTPTLALRLAGRTFLTSDPAPTGFNPAQSQLTFQFPGGPEIANQRTKTAEAPSELVAQPYSLGVIKFGLPWALRCDRSPDGMRLAFDTGSDGSMAPDEAIRWVDLTDLKQVYSPLPGLRATDFAFSPDSQHLAVFGQSTGEASKPSGIYLVDLATGDSRLVLPLEQAHSLVWNPDGESLALIGSDNLDGPFEAMVVHMRTGVITYRVDAAAMSNNPPADWPVPDWGVDFPIEMGGMDKCAAPPGN